MRGEPLRFLPHHHERVARRRDPVERFWEKVDKRGPDECWEWIGARIRTGYGVLSVDGNRQTYAHRFSYELANEPIPANTDFHGFCVLHACDNPSCVNPAHLSLDTHRANMDDRNDKGRCRGARGSAHHRAKLTEGDVRHMRRSYTGGRGEMAIFAKRYGVTIATVQGAIVGRTWRHI